MLRLTTLGTLDLRDRLGHPIREVLAQPKRVALLVYLALEGRRGPVSRERLLALFWPESDSARARNALSQALHHLRQALGTDALSSQGAATVEVCGDRLWCDAVAFGEALERGEPELALDIYRGEFCPTLFVSGAPEFEQWLEGERRRTRRLASDGARALAERLEARGDMDGARRIARRALAMPPDEEADARALIALLERCGDAGAALAAYEEFAARLRRELEVEPAVETRQLADNIRYRREQAAAAAPRLSPPTPWVAAPAASAVAAPAAPIAGRRRARLIAVATFGVVALTALSIVLWRSRFASETPSASTIAVFPFSVRGSAAPDYLREGMVDLLSAKLEGTSGLHAIDPRTVMAALAERRDTAGAAAAYAGLARRLGARRYIHGEIVEVAGRLQITSTLFDLAEGQRAVATATVTGDTTHLFELVDQLSGRVLARLIPGRDTSLTQLAALTTSSLPALKAYLEGEQDFRAGRDAQAAAAFREAVALDSTFALAEYRLALMASWVIVPGIETSARIADIAALANRHARRLSPLARDLLTAYSDYKGMRGAESEARYRRITLTNPDNVEAWFMLGENWFHYNPFLGRPRGESRGAFEHVLALDPGNAHALLHLARLAALEGQVARLDSLAAQYLSRYRDAARTLEIRTLLNAVHDSPAARRAVVRDVLGADDIILMSATQAVMDYAQNLDAARGLAPVYLRSATNTSARDFGRLTLTTLPLSQGRWRDRDAVDLLGADADLAWLRESRALLALALDSALPRSRLLALRDTIAATAGYPVTPRPGMPTAAAGAEVQAWLVGLLSARAGDLPAANRSLAVLAAAPAGPRTRIARSLSRSLQAELARSAGNAAGVLAALHDFPFVPPYDVPLSWGIHERLLMAETEEARAHDDAALGWYESFPNGYDLPWQALAHLRQGRIYERRRDVERARFHYQRAASMWEAADPEFQPLVTEARAALLRLAGARPS